MARGNSSTAKKLLSKSRPKPQHPTAKPAKPQRAPKSLARVQKDRLESLKTQLETVSMADFAKAVPFVEEEEYAPIEEEHNTASAIARATTKAFGRCLKTAVGLADVVVEVLDARDPEGFRSKALEESVLEQGKKLVLLLNKIDLVEDQNIVRRWEAHLKSQHPVVVFRSMTTASRSKLSTIKFEKGKASSAGNKLLRSGYSPLGAADLMSLLSNYARVEKDVDDQSGKCEPAMVEGSAPPESNGTKAPAAQRSITVCIVGMPNVGKSSVINSLMRNTKCLKTGNEPGVTRQVQSVRLTGNISLVDTPGVVLDTHVEPADQILRGTLKDYDSTYCDEAIDKLLSDPAKRSAVYAHFKMTDGEEMDDSTESFLARVCDERGLILTGGKRDLISARQCVIHAWATGAVKYHALPPSRSIESRNIQVVTTPSPELDLDNL